MRLLYISHSFPLPGRPLSNVGGMQRVAVDLERALSRRTDIELITLCLESGARWNGVLTVGFLGKLLREVPRIVRERRVDAILFSSMVTASTVLVLQERLRREGVITAAIPVGRDITLNNPIYQKVVRGVLTRLDLILPISRATAQTALDRGARPDRVHVVPCGVEFPELTGGEDRAPARAELIARLRERGHELDPEALLLTSVGRHQERKGFHWFVEQVAPRMPAGTVYLLAGSGPMTPNIRSAVAARGLEDRVLLLGQIEEDLLVSLYRGSDLFIMPNIHVPGDIEGFGVVMIEAGAAGLPVIAADLEGIRDVITPGENGTLIPSRDADAFVRAIEWYRAHPAERENEARRAERFVRSSFGWDGIAEQHLAHIRALLRSEREEAPTAS